jgi:predicted DNA-binding protein (MmcQ/YjbR family)
MNVESLYRYCNSKPYVTEDLPFGEDVLVFRIGGKMFALMGLREGPLSLNLKCDPARAVELREQYAAVQPGYHMNKRHWNTVFPGQDLPDAQVRALIDHSYQLVFESLPKSVRAALSGASS